MQRELCGACSVWHVECSKKNAAYSTNQATSSTDQGRDDEVHSVLRADVRHRKRLQGRPGVPVRDEVVQKITTINKYFTDTFKKNPNNNRS